MIKHSKTGERSMKNEFDNLKVMHEYAWGLITRGTVDKNPQRFIQLLEPLD